MRWRVRARLPFPVGSGNAVHARDNMDVTRGQAQPIEQTGEPVISAVELHDDREVYVADFPLSGDALGESRANTAADWLQARIPFTVVVGDLATGDPGTDWPTVQVQRCYHDEQPPQPCEVTRVWPPSLGGPWVAPAGGHQPYPLGWVVTHDGVLWRCTLAGTVFEPGVAGWERVT